MSTLTDLTEEEEFDDFEIQDFGNTANLTQEDILRLLYVVCRWRLIQRQ